MTTILIADDHSVVRRGVRDILTSGLPGTEITEAKDSNETTQLLLDGAFDLVLLDINMPGRSGLDVLQEAKRLHPRMPVLVLSAYPEEEFAIRALRLGAAGYLNKQSAADELMAAVKKLLGGGKYVTAALAEKIADQFGREYQIAPHEVLSNRELQVMRLVATGKTLKAIADEMSLSEKTVATYRARVSRKLGLSTNVEITRYALHHKLVD